MNTSPNRKRRQPGLRPKSPAAAGRSAERRIPELYQVIVECRDEADQRAVYQRLTAENRTCRLMIL